MGKLCGYVGKLYGYICWEASQHGVPHWWNGCGPQALQQSHQEKVSWKFCGYMGKMMWLCGKLYGYDRWEASQRGVPPLWMNGCGPQALEELYQKKGQWEIPWLCAGNFMVMWGKLFFSFLTECHLHWKSSCSYAIEAVAWEGENNMPWVCGCVWVCHADCSKANCSYRFLVKEES